MAAMAKWRAFFGVLGKPEDVELPYRSEEDIRNGETSDEACSERPRRRSGPPRPRASPQVASVRRATRKAPRQTQARRWQKCVLPAEPRQYLGDDQRSYDRT